MKKIKTLIAVLMVITMFGALFAGCKKEETTPEDKGTTETEQPADKEEAASDEPKEIKVFTMFNAVPGTQIPDDNRSMQAIAEKIGAWAKIIWLTGQTADERISVMIAGGDYPDFITGATGTAALLEAGALIPIDEYWDDYPNIKNYLSESDWNKVRAEDGHIYFMPQFGIIQGADAATYHWDEAFWIQKDDLIWAN